MANRISPMAAPGSLLKGERPPHKREEMRERKPDYLALVRRLPCLACDNDPAGEAAHLRVTAPGKPITGTGIKPDDQWALPLCHGCHMRQHAIGEVPFWAEIGISPLIMAVDLVNVRGNIEKMRAIIFAARERRK
jgi:hypothetical protein